MTQFSQSNDQTHGYGGTEREVCLPPDSVASEDLVCLDSVEFHSATDKRIRRATGAASSAYLGIVADEGGIDSGYTGRIIRGVTVKKTLVGSVSQGDPVEATTRSTVTALTMTLGPYVAAENIFGYAMQDGTTGQSIDVLVDPVILI